MRLLLDEMLAGAIAQQLRRRGHDAIAAVERPELRGLDDPALFERAQVQARALVTYNRDDFLALDRLHRAERREHNGLVILNPRRFPQGTASVGRLVESLDALVRAGPPYPSFVQWLR